MHNPSPAPKPVNSYRLSSLCSALEKRWHVSLKQLQIKRIYKIDFIHVPSFSTVFSAYTCLEARYSAQILHYVTLGPSLILHNMSVNEWETWFIDLYKQHHKQLPHRYSAYYCSYVNCIVLDSVTTTFKTVITLQQKQQDCTALTLSWNITATGGKKINSEGEREVKIPSNDFVNIPLSGYNADSFWD